MSEQHKLLKLTEVHEWARRQAEREGAVYDGVEWVRPGDELGAGERLFYDYAIHNQNGTREYFTDSVPVFQAGVLVGLWHIAHMLSRETTWARNDRRSGLMEFRTGPAFASPNRTSRSKSKFRKSHFGSSNTACP